MNNYPEAVSKIANDYLERLKNALRLVPAREQTEFLREIESHMYEAYQQTPGDDDVARILAVLRNIGEPSEVVADRLPGAIVRSGTKRSLPLYIIGGVFIALFGIPLGFGGVAVLTGILASLVGIVVAYFATAGMIFLASALVLVLGLTRTFKPEVWDRLVRNGVISMDRDVADFFDVFAPADQGMLMIVLACVFAAAGVGMLWLGRYLIRGIRFLFSLAFEWLRQFAQGVRRRLRQRKQEGFRASQVSYVK